MKTWTLKSLEPSCIIPAQTESFNFHLGLYFSQRNPAFKASSYFTINMTKSRTHHSDGNTRAHTPPSLRLPTWRWCHWMWQLSMVVCERTQSGVFFSPPYCLVITWCVMWCRPLCGRYYQLHLAEVTATKQSVMENNPSSELTEAANSVAS